MTPSPLNPPAKGRRPFPARRAAALAGLLVALAAPASAGAQGAGDEQYSDPFGGSQQQATPTATPAPTQAPAPAASSQATPQPTATAAPSAAAAQAQAQIPARRRLPYTGADAGLLALAGAVLLGAGIALRRRADPQR